MEKLTIRFYHNIPINDNELSMTEYFIPYEKKLLLSLVAEKNTIAEWDILLEENNNIRLSSENNYCTYFYQEENNDKWIDGGSDNKKTSLWDYLAEVNTIYNLYKCFKEEKLSIKLNSLNN